MENICKFTRILTSCKIENPEKIAVSLSGPFQVDNLEWRCEVSIRGKKKWTRKISGVDAFQCLFLSLEEIRNKINKDYSSFEWEGGNGVDHGFSLIVPHFINQSVIKNIEATIDEEMSKRETWAFLETKQ